MRAYLEAPPHTGWQQRWFNDTPGNIEKALEAGYIPVVRAGEPVIRVVGKPMPGRPEIRFERYIGAVAERIRTGCPGRASEWDGAPQQARLILERVEAVSRSAPGMTAWLMEIPAQFYGEEQRRQQRSIDQAEWRLPMKPQGARTQFLGEFFTDAGYPVLTRGAGDSIVGTPPQRFRFDRAPGWARLIIQLRRGTLKVWRLLRQPASAVGPLDLYLRLCWRPLRLQIELQTPESIAAAWRDAEGPR